MNQRRITFYSFIYRGFSALLTFANGAITARYLPPADRGDYQLMGTYASSGQSFSGGFSNYFARALPRRKDDRVQIVQMGNFVMFLFSIIVWLIALFIALFYHPSQVVLFALVGAPLTFLFGYSSRLLNSLGEISWLNRANIAQAISFFVIYIAFILLNRHIGTMTRLDWTFRIWLLTWLISVVMTLSVAYQKLGLGDVLKWKWSYSEWRGLRSFGSWSSLALLSGYVNYRVDFWMVGWLTHNKDLVAIYGIAVVAAEILNTLTQSISSVVFHRVTAADTHDAGAITEIASRQTLISSTLLAVLLAIAMPILIYVYGKTNYASAMGPFYILLPGLVLKATANVVGQYFTNAQGKPSTLLIVNTMVIAFNALICLFAIPLIGMYGAAIASSVAYLFELCVYVIWYHHVSGRQGRDLWRVIRPDFQPYVDVLYGVKRRVIRRG